MLGYVSLGAFLVLMALAILGPAYVQGRWDR